MGQLELQGSHVCLRDFVPEDLEVIAGYTADPEVCRYTSWGPLTPDEASTFVSSAIKAVDSSPRTWYELAIVQRESGDLVGHVGLELDRRNARTAEFGYVLRPPYWGRGLATAAASLLLDYAFTRLALHRIWASTDERNLPSVRVLEKLGLSFEGRHRDNVFIRGEWRTSLTYAALSDDWLKDMDQA